MLDTTDQNSQTRRIAIAIVLVLVVAGGIVWYLNRGDTVDVLPQEFDPPVAAPAPLQDGTPPPILHPLEEVQEEAPAGEAVAEEPVDPDLEAHAALDEIFGAGSLANWLIPEQLSRRLVATTDNLTRNARTEPLRPLRPPAGQFVVERETLDDTAGTERITLAPANAARYDATVLLLSQVDMARAASVYRRIYPRLQRSYEELGYPGAYFNDRVVQAIDHLLATPEPEGPLLLEQPKVMYVYADADLEARSAGQKLLLRMGNAHARVVKEKLREFRAQIATRE